jgi:hypothetical protein
MIASQDLGGRGPQDSVKSQSTTIDRGILEKSSWPQNSQLGKTERFQDRKMLNSPIFHSQSRHGFPFSYFSKRRFDSASRAGSPCFNNPACCCRSIAAGKSAHSAKAVGVEMFV